LYSHTARGKQLYKECARVEVWQVLRAHGLSLVVSAFRLGICLFGKSGGRITDNPF